MAKRKTKKGVSLWRTAKEVLATLLIAATVAACALQPEVAAKLHELVESVTQDGEPTPAPVAEPETFA